MIHILSTSKIIFLTQIQVLIAFRFIGEETFASGEKTEFTNEPTWIVDPIGNYLLL